MPTIQIVQIIIVEGKEVLRGPKFTQKTFDAKTKGVTDFCTVRKGNKEYIYGFTNQTSFKAWVRKHKLLKQYNHAIKHARKAEKMFKHPPSVKKEKEMGLDVQVAHLKAKTEQFQWLLKKKKIKPHEIAKIEKLGSYKDSVVGSPFGCLVLYDKIEFQGRGVVLPPGWWWKFSSFGWNDAAESGYCVVSPLAILYQHKYFGGARLWIWLHAPNANFGWFRNRASSAMVY